MRIKDAIGRIVTEVQKQYNGGDETPYYMYGRPQKIAALLSEKSTNADWKYRKYPLIILLQEFTEKRGGKLESDVNVTVVIVAQADPSNRKENRDDLTFELVLYPIYDLFISELKKSTEFKFLGVAEHDLTESPFWGTPGQYGNDGNIMNDTLDALFIENLNLKLLKNC
jgi:hypothetical protein